MLISDWSIDRQIENERRHVVFSLSLLPSIFHMLVMSCCSKHLINVLTQICSRLDLFIFNWLCSLQVVVVFLWTPFLVRMRRFLFDKHRLIRTKVKKNRLLFHLHQAMQQNLPWVNDRCHLMMAKFVSENNRNWLSKNYFFLSSRFSKSLGFNFEQTSFWIRDGLWKIFFDDRLKMYCSIFLEIQRIRWSMGHDAS